MENENSDLRAVLLVKKDVLLKACLSTADEEKEHGKEDEGEVDKFRLEVFLVEYHCSEEETDKD